MKAGNNPCRAITRACLLLIMMTGVAPAVDSYQPDALFHIERSKNANIVQYDAQVGTDGRLHPRKPVIAYWVRLAEQGQIRKLSWLQKTFAYGFDAKPGADGDSVELEMAADFGRSITVRRDGEDYRAEVMIDGKPAWLAKVYVRSSGKGLSKKIDFIDLFGHDVADGSERHERLVP